MANLLSKPLVWAFFWAVLYLVVALGSIALWSAIKRRRRRFPFKDEERLLRQPGEALLGQVNARDEAFLVLLLFGYFVPLLAGFGLILITLLVQKWSGQKISTASADLMGAGGFLLGVAGWLCLLIRNRRIRSNFYLGYCGERFVAEKLKPLELAGWLIFHDVPASVGKRRFNLDHVAIGPGGVSVIETKAPRKGARFKNGHELEFDGSTLRWPTGKRSRWGMKQTLENAEWLRKFFKTNVKDDVDVMAILTFPTWKVVELVRDPEIRVISPPYLVGAITARGSRVLDWEQIKLYGAQIERLCRNVEL